MLLIEERKTKIKKKTRRKRREGVGIRETNGKSSINRLKVGILQIK